MSLSNTTKFANRCGLDLKVYAYNPTGEINETYALTSDVALASGKTYYTRSGSEGSYTYQPVASPDVEDIGSYYEAQDGALLTIDFANEVSLESNGDNVWATGGQRHSKMIGFRNPSEGTFKISTQVTNVLLERLAAGDDISTGSDKGYTVGDNAKTPTYYIIKGETVWQDENGVAYNETVTIYKACVKPSLSKSWTGDGDPQSKDIEFELAVNGNGDLFHIEYND